MINILKFEPYGFIYITTNNINGKKYIGQRQYSKGWISYIGGGSYLKNAINKYGRKNFTKEIVAMGYNANDLNDLEIEFINKYNAVESDLYYNLKPGGKYGSHSEGTKKKLSVANLGKTLSDETRQKLSEINIGKNVGHNNSWARKIICITTGKVFDCIRYAEKEYGVANQNIGHCLKGRREFAGKLLDGTKLIWMYYEDYIEEVGVI